MADQEYPEAVKRQYDDLPFPPRNPADERRRLLHTAGGSLIQINHFCFAGKKDFRRDFRCLVAGGGTGDCAIFLAEQLKDSDAGVVYLDFSAPSRRIAESRANVRRLKNIQWHSGSLLDLPHMQLGEFDYINCSGVLHLLESAPAGLEALKSVLKPGGAVYLTVYGNSGSRASLPQMRRLLADYLPADADDSTKVRMARQLVQHLPESNRFRADLPAWNYELSHDNGVVDLLMSRQQVCYSVPDLYQLADGAGLQVLGFTGPFADRYDPEDAVDDSECRQYLATLDARHRHILAEQLFDDIEKHELFLGTPGTGVATLADDGNALIAVDGLHHNAPRIAASMVPGQVLDYAENKRQFSLATNPATRIVFTHMQGQTALSSLYREMQAAVPKLTLTDAKAEVARVFQTLNKKGFLYLLDAGSHGAGVPDYGKLLARSGALR